MAAVSTFSKVYDKLGFKKDYSKKPASSFGGGGGASGGSAASTPAPAVSTPAPAVSAAPAANAENNAYAQLKSIYDAQAEAQRRARRAAYDAAVSAQRAEYNANVAKVNSAADKALREAYINKMQSQRIMGQQMAAQGLNGGYSETTAAGLQNNYGNARNALETERSGQLNDLNITLQNNIAAARKILDTGNAGDYRQYLTDVAKLIAANPTQSLSMEQGGAGSTGSGKGLYELYQEMLNSGMSTAEAMQVLNRSGADIRQLFA